MNTLSVIARVLLWTILFMVFSLTIIAITAQMVLCFSEFWATIFYCGVGITGGTLACITLRGHCINSKEWQE